MINFFSNWAEQIIIAVVITSIFEMLLPDNKNKKYIKIVMGIYILFSIISPIIDKKEIISLDTINLESYAVNDNKPKTEEVNQQSMDERLQQLYVEELENNIKTKIKQEGYNLKSCKIDAVLYGDENKQGINKIDIIISKDNDNINTKTNTDIKSVNKVDIQIGLEKYLEKNDDENSENVIHHLKDILSSYYEIEESKIIISIK